MYTYVSNEGNVYVEAIDRNDNIYTEHPISKKKLLALKFQCLKKLLSL